VSHADKQSPSSERERNQLLARKVHDDISQKLTIVGLELALLQIKKANTDPELAAKLEHLANLTHEIGLAVRNIIETLSKDPQ
jgi:signal transduction histidine kinase